MYNHSRAVFRHLVILICFITFSKSAHSVWCGSSHLFPASSIGVKYQSRIWRMNGKFKTTNSDQGHRFTQVENYETSTHFVTKVKQVQSFGQPNFELGALYMLSFEDVNQFAIEAGKALATQYARRDWNEAFISKVSRDLNERFDQSDFIIVREKKENSEPGEMVEMIRLILRPYVVSKTDGNAFEDSIDGFKADKLPIEEFFKTDLRRSSEGLITLPGALSSQALDFIVEVSSFASDKSKSNEISRSLLAGELLSVFYEPSFLVYPNDGWAPEVVSIFSKIIKSSEAEVNEKFMFTYGDRAGVLLYLPLGFKSFDQIKFVDGTRWKALESDNSFLGRQARKRPELQRAFRNMLPLIYANYGINILTGQYPAIQLNPSRRVPLSSSYFDQETRMDVIYKWLEITLEN